MLCLGLWRLCGHCAVAENAISGPLEIVRSLCGGSKCHFFPFIDCAVLVRWLKMLFLGLWRLCGHCAVAQNALEG